MSFEKGRINAERRRRVLTALIVLAGALPSVASAQRTLTLEEAISIARESSPEIRRSRYSLEASEASLRARQASLKTQFHLSLTPMEYSNTNRFNDYFSEWYRNESTTASGQFAISQPIKWTDGTLSLANSLEWRDSYSEASDEESTTFQNNLFLRLEQPLFTYNRTMMDLEELERDFEISSINYTLAELSIEQQVMNLFYSVYSTRMQLEISADALEDARENHEIMKNKVDAGLGRLDDLYQAEVDMMTSEMDWENTRYELANSLDRLKRMIGLPLDDEIDIEADVIFQPVGVDLEFAVRHGLESRLELREAEIRIANAYNNVITAGANNEFKGSLELSYGTTGTSEDFRDMYDKPTENQFVALSFEIPLWDWGRRKNLINAAESRLESNRLDLEEERKGIVIEIREAYRELENQVKQIEIARKRVESARLTYEINLERYRNGDLSAQDLGNYRDSLSNARLSEVRALIDYRLALFDMKVKSLWDFETDEPAIDFNPTD